MDIDTNNRPAAIAAIRAKAATVLPSSATDGFGANNQAVWVFNQRQAPAPSAQNGGDTVALSAEAIAKSLEKQR